MSLIEKHPDDISKLSIHAADAKSWLFDAAALIWSGAGRLSDGMFAERLNLIGTSDLSERRVRVQARQIYSFCELGRLGWQGDWLHIVSQAVDILIARGQRSDGFFIHRFNADGYPADLRADLYDCAFVLFALGHAATALNRPELFSVARGLMETIEYNWANPTGGFNEGEIVGPPRRQNPHMHLLEASMVLYRASGDVYWRGHVAALLALAKSSFIEPGVGALTEFFAEDWSREKGDAGKLVEPGHCLEWSWLLEKASTIGMADIPTSDRLVSFARRYGISAEQNVAINAVTLDGNVLDPGARLWPQAERLKAALVRWRRTGDRDEAADAEAAYCGLRRFFETPTAGVWRDRLQPDGSWIEEPAPASSFYHIVCALSELIETAREP